jgi:signal transduction histidine kinase
MLRRVRRNLLRGRQPGLKTCVVALEAANDTTAAGLADDLKSAAHEIRNLLNAAKLHATLLEREFGELGGSAEAIDSVRVIVRDVDRIAELVSRACEGTEGSRKAGRCSVSLRALCGRAVQLVARDAAESGVEVGVEFDDTTVEVELTSMQQVLLHLLEHAVLAALPAGGKVLFRARRSGALAIVEIRHDGTAWNGPTPILTKVLAPELARELGLNVACRVVAAHGGAIQVNSEAGKTVFSITLPAQADGREREDQAGRHCS